MIEVSYQNALAEVNEILKYTEEDLVAKLPKSFQKFIIENKNNNYNVNINSNIPISEQKLLPETQAILSLMFRSFWATEEEKRELEEKDRKEFKEQEKIKNEVFGNDVFEKIKEREEQEKLVENKTNNMNNQQTENTNQMAITVVQKDNWIKRTWKKFISIFRKK